MHDFFIGESAQNLTDLLGAQAANAVGVRRGIIAQSAGKLDSIGIAQGYHVALAETAGDANDADGQQTSPLLLDGLARSAINVQSAARSRRESEPALLRRQRSTVRQKERADPL